VVPGFTDSHVHFPTWAIAQRQTDLDGCRSLDEALERVRAAPPPEDGGWLRAYGWRSGDWSPSIEPTRSDLDAVTTAPAALVSKDYHSLWLNSAALALADGQFEVRAASSSGTRAASRQASSGRSRPGSSRSVHDHLRRRYVDAMRRA